MNAADKTQRIPNTTFEIRRVSDGGLVDTVTTGTDGRVYVPLESGSYYAVEGITSPDGRVLGKMGHSERSGDNLYKNVDGNKYQKLFEGGVDYFKL